MLASPGRERGRAARTVSSGRTPSVEKWHLRCLYNTVQQLLPERRCASLILAPPEDLRGGQRQRRHQDHDGGDRGNGRVDLVAQGVEHVAGQRGVLAAG